MNAGLQPMSSKSRRKRPLVSGRSSSPSRLGNFWWTITYLTVLALETGNGYLVTLSHRKSLLRVNQQPSFALNEQNMMLSFLRPARNNFRPPLQERVGYPFSSLLVMCTPSSTKQNSHSNFIERSRPRQARAIPAANEGLVASRQRVSLEKKLTRRQYMQIDRERNFRLKRLLHSSNQTTPYGHGNNTMGFDAPRLYAIKVFADRSPLKNLFRLLDATQKNLTKVSVCQDLRKDLRMNGREKRGRVFIELDAPGSKTLAGLKQELHSFFRCLRKSTYLLSASLPEIGADGSVVSPYVPEEETRDGVELPATATDSFWDVDTDEVVQETFQKALKYAEINPNMKRPSILVHLSKDPNAPPPAPPPEYLQNMADPTKTTHMTMLSFYAFPEGGIGDPEEVATLLRKLWRPFKALGRIYVATEGVNAQMAVPTNVMDNFRACCHSLPELQNMENGINIDPMPLSMAEFNVAGDTDSGKPSPPFKNLHVRVRHQVVADGLDIPLDWTNAGYDMPPFEWHEKLKEIKENNLSMEQQDGSSIPLVFDCRNDYETKVGKFEGAEPLNTENFRDSWDVLKERLSDKPKDTPIMTYCTGGIRCVKVGAYLTQELGFKNVSRLAGGIIAYDRAINSGNSTTKEPLFKGTNYVFDGRVGRAITKDELGKCITCGGKTSLLSNCKNDNCHIRMVQCEGCRPTFLGTCSDACKQRVLNSAMMARRRSSAGETVFRQYSHTPVADKARVYETVEDYSEGFSSPIPELYDEIESNTAHHLPTGSHMVSGATQGRFLATLAATTREGRVLEVGTFTGYATACFLEGSANAGDSIHYEGTGCRKGGPFVLSLERDSRALDLAASHLRVMSEFGTGREGALAARKLREEETDFCIDAFKGNCESYTYRTIAGCELLRVSDALATVEEMASGHGLNADVSPFDIVFLDADKTRLLDYVETCLGSERILKKGGLIVVDNVLWKGIVLEATGGGHQHTSTDDHEENMDPHELKRSRRARKLAGLMHEFNNAIVKDERAEVVLLPLRDGLSVIRKR